MKTYNYTLNNKALDSIIDFSLFKKEKSILIKIFCGEKKEILEKLNQKTEAENVAKFALAKLEKMKNETEDYDYYKEMLEKHITKK